MEAGDARAREFIGESESVAALRQMARVVAAKNATLLISGESGTGKEVLARYVYAHSARAGRPFVAINCAAIPDGLVESELFGHEKGAFTGATATKPGCFELAHGGTLFLDEVTEVRPHLQAKLLRVLQEREIRRVGGTSTRPVDVRIIAASSRDLHACLADGSLRSDLYYRLAMVELAIPPLRERKQDLLPLCRSFLRRHAGANGSPLADVSPEALAVLSAYDWPGNVRELENAIARATVLVSPEDGELLRPEHLPARVCPPRPAPIVSTPAGGPLDLRLAILGLKARYVDEALRRSRGNKAEAARMLGVSRRGFYNLVDEVAGGPAAEDAAAVA